MLSDPTGVVLAVSFHVRFLVDVRNERFSDGLYDSMKLSPVTGVWSYCQSCCWAPGRLTATTGIHSRSRFPLLLKPAFKVTCGGQST